MNNAVDDESSRARRWHWGPWLLLPLPLIAGLIWIVRWQSYWSHSSAMAVWQINGLVRSSNVNAEREGSAPTDSTSVVLDAFTRKYKIRDDEVTGVRLLLTGVDHRWLGHLCRLSNLETLDMDGGLVGDGMRNLATLSKLKEMQIVGQHRVITPTRVGDIVDSTIDCHDFLLVPHLESLSLHGFDGPNSAIRSVTALKNHPHLKSLSLSQISHLAEVLESLQECKNVETLKIFQKKAPDEAVIVSICRLVHLKSLSLDFQSGELEQRIKASLPETDIQWGLH